MTTAWPLVGRNNQLQLVSEAIGRHGTTGVVIAGGPGLGKTRLATEALAQAKARGFPTAWAVATNAAASIPFGPLAHLLPDGGAEASSRLELLRQVGRAFVRRAGGKRLVLGVDDAHLLDDASAALVHHLATTSTAFILATVRTGEPTSDAVTALWKDPGTEWLELSPLDEVACAALVEGALGGQVDGATLHELCRLSQGNALFLHELVIGGLETGTLTQIEGIWRATGSMATSTRLVEVVEARLGRLPSDLRAVAELVAVGEPLSVPTLEALALPEQVDALDRAGLLELVSDPRRALVRLIHPLYGEQLRETAPPLRARAIRRQLAEALETTGARRHGDLLRLLVWQTAGGITPKSDLLVRAARQATARFFSDVLAEHLAAAYAAEGELRVGLACAEARVAQGRAAEAERLLVELQAKAVTNEERSRVALARARNLLHGLGRWEDALQVLSEAEATVIEPRWRDEFAVFRANAAINQGRPVEALDAARSVLTRPDAHERVALRALVVTVTALAFQGRTGDAIAAANRALEPLGDADAEPSLVVDQLFTVRSFAQCLDGRLDEAEACGLTRCKLFLKQRADDLRAACALALGEVALARGAAQTAVRRLREGLPLLREHGMLGLPWLSWCLGLLAQAAATGGDARLAERALAEFNRITPADFYIPSGHLAPAWIAVLHGNVDGGRDLALRAADQAAERGCDGFEAVALHDAVRLGAAQAVAARLAELATRVQGRLTPTYAAHTTALATGDAAQLEQVAKEFASMGANLLAAEVAAEAAHQHRLAGSPASALAAAARSRALAASCEGVRTPALELAGIVQPLTTREREVATLAAKGWSNARIAEQLILSIRTVESHLYHAYDKLGVSSREELADRL
jgi:DNA-binding CsgD family transcriptional regulator/tetratricopeptide (TPR) repeat protein